MKSKIHTAALAAACLTAANANPVPLGKSLLEPLGKPVSDGALILNSRLRYEFADQAKLDDSNAFTLRTRLGYQSGVYSGFSFLAEGEYNWELNSGDYAPYPGFNGADTVIADGESLDINRLFLKYANGPFTGIVGRQDINQFNQRFIGTVAWRQNDQTFDAARIQYTPITGLILDYTYNWQVNRIFGSEAPTSPLKRLESENHFLTATYTGVKNLTLGAYAYLLHFDVAAAQSSDTYGLFAEGSTPINPTYMFKYRTEWAYQMDNSDTAAAVANLEEHYVHLRGSVARDKYEGGLGFESLGGNGASAFQTPLATLHLFNGWADTFLTTPNNGLRDYYAFATAPLFWGINGRIEAHYYTGEEKGDTYGQEYSISLVKKFNDNLSVLAKASQYEADSALAGVGADKTKFWLQLDYTF